MSSRAGRAVEKLRKPEYTGENRCVPCTIANAVIAVVASALVGLVAPPAGLVVLAGSAFLIYVRGYLVPGTPELTRRYLPARVRALFDDHPAVRTSDTSETDGEEWETLRELEYEREHSVDPEAFLVDVGAVDSGADDRELRADFADDVERRAERYRTSSVPPEAVADLFGVPAEGLAFEDREYPAIKVKRRIRKWPSEGALLADVATHEALTERSDEWLNVPREQRVEILETLRTYLDACPECGGELAFHDETFESCCGRYEVAVYGCRDCEEHLLEFDPALVDADPNATGIVPDLDQR